MDYNVQDSWNNAQGNTTQRIQNKKGTVNESL